MEHIIYVIIFFLRACAYNCLLLIGLRHFLNLLLYWYPGTTQSLSFLEQVKQFILAFGSLPDQLPIYLYSSLYNLPNSGPSNLTLVPSTDSGRFKATVEDIDSYGAWFLVVSLYGANFFIRVYSCLYSSDKKQLFD